jgi:hypothetical protein
MCLLSTYIYIYSQLLHIYVYIFSELLLCFLLRLVMCGYVIWFWGVKKGSPLPLTLSTQKIPWFGPPQSLKSPYCSNIWFSHWKQMLELQMLLKSKCWNIEQTLETKNYVRQRNVEKCFWYNVKSQKKSAKWHAQSGSGAILKMP